MKKYGITLFLTLILLLGLVMPAVSAQVPEAALAAAQEQVPELLDAAVVAKGIDVSHHQGAINWDAVAGQIDFAVIRCGFGGNLTAQDDRQWSANVAACERLGIPYGVYLYSYAETDDEASDEAQHVLRLLQGHTPQLPVYLDLEDSVISSNCSAADILRHTTIFCNTIQAAGYRAGVYANRNWWTTLLTDAAYDQWERWIAVWADQTNYNKPYQMWQYSSKGQISGLSGNVDLDYWSGAPLTGTHRHTYQVTAQTAATCTQPGQTTYTCTCGATKTETTAALGHNYGAWTTYTAPTCTVAGMERSVCTRCAAYQERTVAATGVHKWDAGVLVQEATCTEDGCRRYTCTQCGTTKDETLPAAGNSYEKGKCTVCGQRDPELLLGDLTGDGKCTSADAVLLVRYLSDLEELTEEQLLAADMNGDGRITSADAVALVRLLAGLV